MGIGPKRTPEARSGEGEAPPLRPFARLYGAGAAQVTEVEDGWRITVVLPEAPPPCAPAAPASPPPALPDLRVPADWQGVLAAKDGRLGVVLLDEAPAWISDVQRALANGAEGVLVLRDGRACHATLEGAGGLNVWYRGQTPVIDASALLKRIEALEAALKPT